MRELFDTATEVLVEQLKINTLRHQNFLNIMRNQWRYVEDTTHPPKGMPPSAGRRASRICETSPMPITMMKSTSPSSGSRVADASAKVGDNLADDPLLAAAMRQARLSTAPLVFGRTRFEEHHGRRRCRDLAGRQHACSRLHAWLARSRFILSRPDASALKRGCTASKTRRRH